MWMCLLFPLLASTYNTHDGMKGRHCQCLVGISMICVTGWYVMGDGMGWDGGMPNMGWGIDRSGMGSPVQHDRAVRGSVARRISPLSRCPIGRLYLSSPGELNEALMGPSLLGPSACPPNPHPDISRARQVPPIATGPMS